METKTDKAKMLYASGDLKGALGIYRTFRLGFSTEEKRVIEIAYESLTGKENFYRELGIDTSTMIVKAEEIINANQGLKSIYPIKLSTF
jgi:hypothetical protein